MTPITNEALNGLFLFMPSGLPVCYSYLAGKQHPVGNLICWLLAGQTHTHAYCCATYTPGPSSIIISYFLLISSSYHLQRPLRHAAAV